MGTPAINPIPGYFHLPASGLQLGPFARGGDLYVVGFSQWNEAAGFQAGLPSVVSAWKSSDNGTTWAIQDGPGSISIISLDEGGGATPFPDARSFCCLRHPVATDQLWLVYVDTASNVRVSVFNMATDSWVSTSPAGPVAPFVTGLNAYQTTVDTPLAAFETTTMDLVVMLWDYIPAPGATTTPRPLTVRYGGGVWGAATPWPGLPPLVNAGDSYNLSSICQGTNGRVHGFMGYTDITAPLPFLGYHHLMADGAGGAGATTDAMGGSIQTRNYTSNCLVSGEVILLGSDAVGEILIHAPSAPVPAWVSQPLPPGVQSSRCSLFPDQTTVPVARVVNIPLAPDEIRTFTWNPATTSLSGIEVMVSGTAYSTVSGGRVGSWAAVLGFGPAGGPGFSLTFSGPPAPVPVLIPGALQPGQKVSSSNGPFVIGGNWYVVAFNSWNEDPVTGNPDGTPSFISVWVSLDNGATWAEQDPGNAQEIFPQNGAISNRADTRFFQARESGGRIYVFYFDTALRWRVAEFNPALGAWSAVSAPGPQAFELDASMVYNQIKWTDMEIETTTGDIIVAGVREKALVGMVEYARISHARIQGGIGGAWTPVADVPDQAGVNQNFGPAYFIRGSGGRVHLIVHQWVQTVPARYQVRHWLAADGAGGSGANTEVLLDQGLANTFYIPLNSSDGWSFTTNGRQLGCVSGSRPMGADVECCFLVGYADAFAPATWNLNLVTFLSTNPTGTVTERTVVDQVLPMESALVSDGNTVWVYYQNASDGGRMYRRAWDGALSAPELFYDTAWSDAPYTAGLWFRVSGGQTGSHTINFSTAVTGVFASNVVILVAGAPGPVPVPAIMPVPEGNYKEPLLKPPNYYDCCLDRFRVFVEANLGRLQPNAQSCEMVEMPGGYMMPAEGREWYERVSIITPAINPAPGQVVLDFQCPTGYRGLLYGITNLYLGAGFVQGSGDLIWRLQIGNAWIRDMGEMLYMLGAVGQPFPLTDQYLIAPGQRVRMYVQVVNASGAIQVGVARMVMELQGWWMPE